MDVIAVLKSDHQKVAALFEKIEGATPRALKAKQKAFLQIKEELTVHAAAEEALLYPRIKEMESLRHNGFEADEEHALVKQLLAQIDELEPESELWAAKCKVLKDLVEHHVEEEEGEIFPTLRKEMNRKELLSLGEEVLEFKEKFKPNPAPSLASASAKGGKGKRPSAPVAKTRGTNEASASL